MKIGARIVKTGITLVLSLYISQTLNLEPEIFAAIAATLAIQPSIYRSWQYGIEQIQANVVGATIAIFAATYINNNPIIVAIVIMIVIGINLQLKFERSIPLSIVTVLSIMEGGGLHSNFLLFAVDRFLLILIGILSALIVNTFLFPPKYDQRLIKSLKNIEEQMNSMLRIILDENKNERTFKSTLHTLQTELKQLWDLFRFEEEAAKSFFQKKIKITSSRKLVILKGMLETADVGIQMFHKIDKHEGKINHLPEHLFIQFQQQLMDIANYQDKIYLKFEGKINSSHHTEDEDLLTSQISLYDLLIDHVENRLILMELLGVVSAINEYRDHLDHLERLIDSYNTHHRKN